jgi:TolA-binding protein
MLFKRFIPVLYFVFLLFAGLSINGCGVWHDFTTYFNLYYDTKDLFDSAEETIQSQKKDLFSNEEETTAGAVNQQLSKVIDKCSSILQFHSNSSYVDKALLMLGKSFYYQRNYLKALRKFQELIATQPKSDLILETELWIGKTQMRLKEYDDGLATLETVKNKAIEEGEDEFVTAAFLEEIKYKIAQEDYSGAITASTDYLKQSEDDEINAEIEFELGKLYEKVNDLENAITAFKNVFEYSPTYDTQYSAKLELGRALREADHNEEALAVFEDMKSEDKYSDNYDEIDLERGKTLVKLNQYQEAVDVLVKVDTTYRSSLNAGMARFELGQIFETHYQNFDSANTYYSKAATSAAPPEYLTSSNQKAQLFKKYFLLRNSLNANLKKQFYAENPDQFTKDSTDYYNERKDIEQQVVAEQEFAEVRAKMDSALFAQDTTGLKIDTTIVKRDSLNQFGQKVLDQFGQTITITDTVITNPIDSLKNQNNLLSSIRSPKFEKRVKELMNGKEPPVAPNLSVDSLQSLITKDRFELGNLFFTEFNIPDSAYTYYTKTLESNPNTNYKARTLYALGSYYLTKNDSVKADSLFNIIYTNYKGQSIVNAAANKLGKSLIDLNFDPAEDIYASAEKEMLDDKYDSSLVKFSVIYNQYPASPLAPKALYASGWILENKLDQLDSAAALYDSLKLKYPATIYANKISQKINIYNQEQQRLAKAREDSLKKMEALRLDSLSRADSLNIKLQPADTVNTNIEKPPDQVDEHNLNRGDQVSDSLDNKTPLPIDSLRRNDEQNIEELQKKSESEVDSLTPGRIKRKR